LTSSPALPPASPRVRAEIDALDAMGVDAVAGMAVYSGAMEA